MMSLRLIEVGYTASGTAFALLAATAFFAGRRFHPAFLVASAAFALAAIPDLEKAIVGWLAWFGLAEFQLSPSIGVLLWFQDYVLLVAALAVVWPTVGLLRQDRPNSSLKRTDQSLRD
jgi:hypothetical protein